MDEPSRRELLGRVEKLAPKEWLDWDGKRRTCMVIGDLLHIRMGPVGLVRFLGLMDDTQDAAAMVMLLDAMEGMGYEWNLATVANAAGIIGYNLSFCKFTKRGHLVQGSTRSEAVARAFVAVMGGKEDGKH